MRNSRIPSPPPLRGEMSRSDRGGSAASDQISIATGNPPFCLRHRPRKETFAKLTNPLSPPCGGRCHGVTEGGVRAQRIDRPGMGAPPLPSASPPQGGRRGLMQRSPQRGEKGSYASVSSRGGDTAIGRRTGGPGRDLRSDAEQRRTAPTVGVRGRSRAGAHGLPSRLARVR